MLTRGAGFEGHCVDIVLPLRVKSMIISSTTIESAVILVPPVFSVNQPRKYGRSMKL